MKMREKSTEGQKTEPFIKKDYVTLKEMALNTGCSYGTLKRDIDLGHLPAYRIGRKYFIKLSEASAYTNNVRQKLSISGYTIKELMEILPLSYAFLVDLIKTSQLEAVKIGRQYVVPKESFERFMRENKIEL